ncbi:MAG: hypothetical protein K5987_06070 [Lachnospiraceae bacterium]|nr:hypothetical protein [Lachnospiraceae bacterium]
MGRAFECIGRLAGTPYTMKDTHVNIYSVEELCYHLVNNAELTGDLNDTEELADWLEQECALKELAAMIKGKGRRSVTPALAAETILTYCHFCKGAELERTLKVIRSSGLVAGPERTKALADYFLAGKRYSLAFSGYESLYRYAIERGDEGQTAENAYYLGIICARLFYYRDAAEFFKTSFDLSHDKGACFAYLAAKRLSMSEEDYIKFITSLPAEYTEASKVEEALKNIKKQDLPDKEHMKVFVQNLKEEYRNCMSG